MTKVIILGDSPTENKKKIEFMHYLNEDGTIYAINTAPSQYENIELISLNYGETFDLMFAYDYDRLEGTLFLGKFNDGVV